MALLEPSRVVDTLDDGHLRCGQQEVEVSDGVVSLLGDPVDVASQLDALWATLHAIWHMGCTGEAALDRLDLLR